MFDCPFCTIELSRKVAESEYSIAFYDKFPVNNGHILVVPKRHTPDYFNLNKSEKKDIWQLVEKVNIQLQDEYNPDGFNIGINVG